MKIIEESKKSNQPNKLPLTSDIVFKRVFSKEENKDLLQSLLESILGTKIKSIEIKNPEMPPDLSDVKAGTLDLKVAVNEDTIIDVEMQVENENNIDDRETRYLVAMSNDQLKKGELYTQVRKLITISILKFNFYKRNSFLNIAHMKFEGSKPEMYVDMGYNREEELLTDKLEMITIELPKFQKQNPSIENELNQWLWLILGEEEKIKMAEKKNKKIKKAVEIVDTMSMDPKEWELYRSRQMAIINYNIGMQNSRKQGEEIGEKRGEKRGREKEKVEIAKKLLKLGIEVDTIIGATGLTKEEIEAIENN